MSFSREHVIGYRWVHLDLLPNDSQRKSPYGEPQVCLPLWFHTKQPWSRAGENSIVLMWSQHGYSREVLHFEPLVCSGMHTTNSMIWTEIRKDPAMKPCSYLTSLYKFRFLRNSRGKFILHSPSRFVNCFKSLDSISIYSLINLYPSGSLTPLLSIYLGLIF